VVISLLQLQTRLQQIFYQSHNTVYHLIEINHKCIARNNFYLFVYSQIVCWYLRTNTNKKSFERIVHHVEFSHTITPKICQNSHFGHSWKRLQSWKLPKWLVHQRRIGQFFEYDKFRV